MEELEALLVIVRPPPTVPALDGAKIRPTFTLWPGVRTVPVGKPLTVTPGVEMLTFETVTLPAPEFPKVTVCDELEDPTLMLPKPTDVGFAVNVPVAGGALFTVNPTLPVTVL